MMQGELKPGSIKISRLRTKILEGEIKIPPFQRKFVWNEEQVLELLDSIYKDYPIGSVLVWETNEELSSRREVGGFDLPKTAPELPLLYILDGQQRITSVFSVFCYEDLVQSNKEFASKFDIVFDIKQKIFKMKHEVAPDDLVMPLSLLFDNYKFNQYMAETSSFDEKATKEATELQAIFQNYELPTVTIKKRTKDEVGIIFERVNSTGTPLSTLDLLTAWTWGEDYYLREVFDNIYDILEQNNFDNLKEKLLLQCFSGIISESTKTNDILKLNPDDVRDKTATVIESIKKTVDLLSTEFNVKTGEFLPKPQQFVGLVYLYSKINSFSADQLNVVKKWFWRTSFSNRYSAGTDDKMNEDIVFFNSVIESDFSGLRKYKSDLSVDVFTDKTLAKSNSWSRATLLLLASNHPKDLANGSCVDVGVALSNFNRKEYHHIFPRKFLKEDRGLSTSEINKLANFCLLPATSNKKISGSSPSKYFFTIIPKATREEILQSNYIPVNFDIFKDNNYSKFVESRAKLLLNAAKKKMGES